MTPKRFIIDEYFEIGSVVIDTENENVRFKHENKLSMKQCCDLLNEQHETIQRLKQNINELIQIDVEEDLLNENEELKSKLGYEKRQHKHWKKECLESIKEIAQLKKEIVQLKGDDFE